MGDTYERRMSEERANNTKLIRELLGKRIYLEIHQTGEYYARETGYVSIHPLENANRYTVITHIGLNYLETQSFWKTEEDEIGKIELHSYPVRVYQFSKIVRVTGKIEDYKDNKMMEEADRAKNRSKETTNELDKLFIEASEKNKKEDECLEVTRVKENERKQREVKERKKRLQKLKQICKAGLLDIPKLVNCNFKCPKCLHIMVPQIVKEDFFLKEVGSGLFDYSFSFVCNCGYEYYDGQRGSDLLKKVAVSNEKSSPLVTKEEKKMHFFILQRMSKDKKISPPKEGGGKNFLKTFFTGKPYYSCPKCLSTLKEDYYSVEFEKDEHGPRTYLHCKCGYEYIK